MMSAPTDPASGSPSPAPPAPAAPGADRITEACDGPQATARLAERLADALDTDLLRRGGRFIVTLDGDLGAGKTHVARALLRRIGATGRIRSPSFTLLEPYKISGYAAYHFDLYRFSDPEQWLDAGFDDILDGGGLVLVEWPQRAAGLLPPADLSMQLLGRPDAPDWRDVVLHADTGAGRSCLSRFTGLRDAAAPGFG